MGPSDRTGKPLASAAPPGSGRRRPRWKLWGGIGLALLVVAGSASYLAAQTAMRARLMRADPDAIVQDAALKAFATASAQPAYDQHCASCHGDHLQGDPRNGVPDLTHPAWLYGEGRVAQIEHTILHGIRAGEELNYDYGLIIDEKYTKKLKAEYLCLCGAKKCRGTMLAPKGRQKK